MTNNNHTIPLLTIAAVSAVLNFAGFSIVLDATWFQQSLAALTSIAVFVVLYGFWNFAFLTIPPLKSPLNRFIGWAITFVGCLGIISISAYWNVVALAGPELHKLSLRKTVIVAEQHLSQAIAQSGTYKSLPPQITALSGSVEALAEGEVNSGAISGKAGAGSISKILYQIKDKVDAVSNSLASASSKVESLSSDGQVCLANMRGVRGSQNAERKISNNVDCINRTIAGLNNQNVAAQITQALLSLTQGMVLPSSIKTKAQGKIVNRILEGIQTQANAIAKRAATLKSRPVIFVSNQRPNIMQAALIHWRSIVPPIATAIAIDLLPLLLLAFMVLAHRDADTRGSNTSTTTLREVERIHADMKRIRELENSGGDDPVKDASS